MTSDSKATTRRSLSASSRARAKPKAQQDTFADVGLLTPVAAGHDAGVADAAVARGLLEAEVALARAAAVLDLASPDAAAAVEQAAAELAAGLDVAALAADAVAGGNPVIPLVAQLRAAAETIGGTDASALVHRGATSQDIVDTALALVAARAGANIDAELGRTIAALVKLAAEHRDTLAVARTLGQHSTPTTWGFRLAGWAAAANVARTELAAACSSLPAQLGGASGTLASFVELYGADAARRLPAAFAAELDLVAPELPWQVLRRPFTRVADAVTSVLDVLGVIASDVALAARTEAGEAVEPSAPGRGGSSAMPHKRNPVLSVLIRSAALRAPGLGAELHRAAALAVDERPDGAWHSEWPALRELLRLGLGAAANAATLTAGLAIDVERAAANLALTGDDIVSEQAKLTGEPGAPESYTGLAGVYVDEVVAALGGASASGRRSATRRRHTAAETVSRTTSGRRKRNDA